MSIYVYIKVNGKVVKAYGAQRLVAVADTSAHPKTTYEYEVYEYSVLPSGSSGIKSDFLGRVRHKYGDGAASLAKKILDLVGDSSC